MRQTATGSQGECVRKKQLAERAWLSRIALEFVAIKKRIHLQ